MWSSLLIALVYSVFDSHCLSMAKSTKVIDHFSEMDRNSSGPEVVISRADEDNCDMSGIPAMDEFDMDKFSGTWYELAKTVSGYIDVDDGMWKVMVNNASNERYKFLFSGRDTNGHCIRPIPGLIQPAIRNPGEIVFKYRTYSTHVSETFRILFTDYDNFAALYACAYINEHTQKCHPGGVYGAIWSRKSHVQHDVFDNAAAVLKKACITKSTLRVRFVKGPCKIDDLGIRDEMIIPAPNICYLPVSPGSCRGRLKRYYYNEYEKNCHEFEFSGCGGNNNNFFTKNECANMCMEISSKDTVCRETSICALGCPPCCREVNDGCVKCSCETIITEPLPDCLRDAFQCPEECDAEELYPGCYICVCEDVYPDTKEEISPVCLEVKDKGKCSDRQERFYFNVLSLRCEKFNYTGCGGNKNNFGSLEQCEAECRGAEVKILHADPVDKKFGDPGGDRANGMLSTYYTIFLCIFFSILWLR